MRPAEYVVGLGDQITGVVALAQSEMMQYWRMISATTAMLLIAAASGSEILVEQLFIDARACVAAGLDEADVIEMIHLLEESDLLREAVANGVHAESIATAGVRRSRLYLRRGLISIEDARAAEEDLAAARHALADSREALFQRVTASLEAEDRVMLVRWRRPQQAGLPSDLRVLDLSAREVQSIHAALTIERISAGSPVAHEGAAVLVSARNHPDAVRARQRLASPWHTIAALFAPE